MMSSWIKARTSRYRLQRAFAAAAVGIVVSAGASELAFANDPSRVLLNDFNGDGADDVVFIRPPSVVTVSLGGSLVPIVVNQGWEAQLASTPTGRYRRVGGRLHETYTYSFATADTPLVEQAMAFDDLALDDLDISDTFASIASHGPAMKADVALSIAGNNSLTGEFVRVAAQGGFRESPSTTSKLSGSFSSIDAVFSAIARAGIYSERYGIDRSSALQLIDIAVRLSDASYQSYLSGLPAVEIQAAVGKIIHEIALALKHKHPDRWPLGISEWERQRLIDRALSNVFNESGEGIVGNGHAASDNDSGFDHAPTFGFGPHGAGFGVEQQAADNPDGFAAGYSGTEGGGNENDFGGPTGSDVHGDVGASDHEGTDNDSLGQGGTDPANDV